MIRNNVNLLNREEVELFIKKYQNWSDGHKMVAAYAYSDFCKMLKIEWTPPKYRWKETIPFVPTEKEVDALVAGTSKKVSITLQGLKETGFRVGELWDCKWTDLDEEKCTIKCQGEKHGKPREQKISPKLYNRFMTLPRTNEFIFGKNDPDSIRWTFDQQRKRLAAKLNNPRLNQIHFHTLRHYYATKYYNETKSIVEVSAKLGHRKINSTMVYTHIVQFDEESQNYYHAIARDEKEAGELIDNGWTYILTTPQNVMMFRKRR
jgi:integrase